MKRVLYFCLIFLFISIAARATHNNAGEIIYEHIGDSTPTYKITIITYTDPSSPADRDSLDLVIYNCNDLSTPIFDIVVKRTFKGPTGAPDIQKNEYTLSSITLPGIGCYQISMTDPNRIEGIDNIAGSVNVPFYLEDTLIIPDFQFFGFNSSPRLLSAPVDFGKVNETFEHNPNAYDPDGDSLHFQLIPPKENPVNDVPGYWYPNNDPQGPPPPNNLTIDPNSGELVWENPHYVGIYNVAILIREFRKGRFIGSMIRDMQIRITNNSNNPPQISNVNDTCIIANSPLSVTVTATDPDVGQILTLTAEGGPFFVNNPAVFNTSSSTSPATGTFNWNTDCTHIRPGFYTVVFKAEDNFTLPGGISQPLVDIETWLIRVVGPPPSGLVASPDYDKINLSWDSLYTCANASNFRGFTVWRKAGCDSLQLDTCQTGGLSALGYTKISGNTFLQNYSFTDNNVKRGVVYSYRVQAEFAESVSPNSPYTYNEVSSMPSSEACIELPKIVPLITNVDVLTTDNASGTMFVRWTKPFLKDLDTIENPGPYKFEVYRYIGNQGGTGGTAIQTYTSNSFAGLNDTFFTDTGLNTFSTQYSYVVGFFATNSSNQFYKIGESDPASSVFLTVIPADSKLDLSWQENVPWVNYEYVVFRETPTGSGNFVSIDTVVTQSYVDEGLKNGEEYCYYVQSIGSYFNPDIPDILLNKSQRACGVPIDTVSPCPPTLNVINDCESILKNQLITDLVNTLTWNNPNNICADDVVKYNIYYSPIENTELELLVTIDGANDTSFLHEVASLAGCYAVTAIDSFNNESEKSNIICVDNCPIYELPNAFTPNGDGANDFFKPFTPYYFVDHIDIKIYSRWGNLVFSTTDPDIMWNGKDQKTGKDVSDGVYYYVCDVYEIRLNGVVKREEPLGGYIHLIRGNGNTN